MCGLCFLKFYGYTGEVFVYLDSRDSRGSWQGEQTADGSGDGMQGTTTIGTKSNSAVFLHLYMAAASAVFVSSSGCHGDRSFHETLAVRVIACSHDL